MLFQNRIESEDIIAIAKKELPWKNLSGKTVLITGANGFLPAYMIKTLIYLNEQLFNNSIKIVALARNFQKLKERFGNPELIPNFHTIIQDVTQPINYEGEIDHIIHAASQASPKYYGTDPVGTLAANTIGTYHLLEFAAKKKATRFLYFSSSEIYGSLAADAEITEDMQGSIDPLNIRSCYAESKRMGETMCISFAVQHKLDISIVRPFHTYGPGLALDDGRVFADFVNNIVTGNNIVINSDGSAVRSFCYLRDATEGFFTVLLKGENMNAYNIGNPAAAVSIKELALLLVDSYPEKKLTATFSQADNKGYLKSSFNRLIPSIKKMNALGWFPVITIKEGFKRTVDSFINN